jgi:hypothetical protein
VLSHALVGKDARAPGHRQLQIAIKIGRLVEGEWLAVREKRALVFKKYVPVTKERVFVR